MDMNSGETPSTSTNSLHPYLGNAVQCTGPMAQYCSLHSLAVAGLASSTQPLTHAVLSVYNTLPPNIYMAHFY